MNDEDTKLLKEYVSINQLNMSQFIRELIIDTIEDDLSLNEERILNAHLRATAETKYEHTEVWEMLGI